jgi:EmrB/QacA subfamily drug resistance transporter
VFNIGVAWFCTASLLCAFAPNVDTLIAARALQGVGGALLTPGSLSLIQASIAPEDRARAVGLWSGLGGVTGALGPFIGGWLVEHASWRWAFGINLPLGLVVVLLSVRLVPESRSTVARRMDVPGLLLVVVALGLLTLGATSGGDRGWSLVPIAEIVGGLAVSVVFVLVEMRSRHALVPPSLFANRTFTGTNLMTFCTYGALGVVLLVLTLQLQTSAGYSPLQAGIATLPITLLLLVLSPRSGALSARIGPKPQLIIGPLVAAAALVLSLRIDATHKAYLSDVFPAVFVFGVGLVLLVAPLTAAVMAAAPAESVGIASGVNNAVARSAGLLAVAVLPPLAGLTGSAYLHPDSMTSGYRGVAVSCIILLVAGAAVVALVIPSAPFVPVSAEPAPHPTTSPTRPT